MFNSVLEDGCGYFHIVCIFLVPEGPGLAKKFKIYCRTFKNDDDCMIHPQATKRDDDVDILKTVSRTVHKHSLNGPCRTRYRITILYQYTNIRTLQFRFWFVSQQSIAGPSGGFIFCAHRRHDCAH